MRIITGIASTTHIDKYNDKMAKSALDGMAYQINNKFIPQLVNHDWNKHIGVILYGKVFQLKDGEYALGIVSGLFENNKERNVFAIGGSNDKWEKYKNYLNVDELIQLNEQQMEKEPVKLKATNLNMSALLERHLDSTKVLPNGTVYGIKQFIASTGDLRIEIYPKDHTPYQPHFHVISKQREIDARFGLFDDNVEFINMKNGKIKSDDIKKIKNFFVTHPHVFQKLKSELKRMA